MGSEERMRIKIHQDEMWKKKNVWRNARRIRDGARDKWRPGEEDKTVKNEDV